MCNGVLCGSSCTLMRPKGCPDLRLPPGNRLEELRSDRAGRYSIRVTDRWRLCFRWLDGGSYDVEIVEYH